MKKKIANVIEYSNIFDTHESIASPVKVLISQYKMTGQVCVQTLIGNVILAISILVFWNPFAKFLLPAN